MGGCFHLSIMDGKFWFLVFPIKISMKGFKIAGLWGYMAETSWLLTGVTTGK